MLVTDGIVRLANALHPKKAEAPMLVTDDGISRLANVLHPSKAPSPMLVTLFGIVRLANELHPKKALSPMVVTDDGIRYTILVVPEGTSNNPPVDMIKAVRTGFIVV